MRNWLWVLVGLLLLPVAGAQIQSILVDVSGPLDLSEATAPPEVVAAECGGVGGNGTADSTYIDAANGTLGFSEAETGTACGEVRVPIIPPANASRATVSFAVDRQISNPTNNPVIRMRQEIRHYVDDAQAASAALFETSSPAAPATNKSYQYSVSGPFSLAWFFADDGYTPDPNLPSPGNYQGLSSNVTTVRITYPDVPFEDYNVTELDPIDEDRNRTFLTKVSFSLPGDWVTGSTSFRLTATNELVAIGGVLDGVNISALDPAGRAGAVTYTVGPALVSDGVYEWTFSRRVALPPPPPPAPPETFAAIFFVAAALPAAAGGLATFGAAKYRSQAAGRYVRNARRAIILVAVLLLYHIALAVYGYFVQGLRPMTEIPLSPLAIGLYIQMALLFIGFLVLYQITGRTLVHQMEIDLKERAERERELSRSNKELEQFAYVASHDLQEPLRKVASFSQMLQKRYKGKLDDEADEYINYTVEGAKRMQSLVQDLLGFSRVGKTDLRIDDVDMNHVVKLVLRDLEGRIQDEKGDVTAGPLPTVRGDKALLQQLMQNLIGNGLKYRAKDRPPEVRIDAKDIGDLWQISVRDNGIGIAPEHRQRIFEIFQRLHGRGEYEGTGIGLALAMKIIELHKGDIRVDSVVGAGSTFIFEIPKNLG